MIITVLILLIALYLLEKIVPYSRDIKGIENGNIAHYYANTALNEALLSMSGSNPGFESGSTIGSFTSSGYSFQIAASGMLLPPAGQGISEYDQNWSIIGQGNPIQIVLPTGIDWTLANTYIRFRVPDLDQGGSNNETLSGGTSYPVINWVLSGSGTSLIASGSQIMASNVYRGDGTAGTDIHFNAAAFRDGLTPDGTASTFAAFYNTLGCSVNVCTLKFSLINPLTLSTPANILAPYLEYQASFNIGIPLQYATVKTQGFAMGFRQDMTKMLRQLTTNEALDFTVFQ